MAKTSLRAFALISLFAIVAGSCGQDAPEWTPLPPLDYGSAPAAVDANAFGTSTPIKHVVFVIKENRTFDNLFGLFPGANGVGVGMDQGEPRPLTPAIDRLEQDIRHCYDCALQAWNGGKMDGFATISEWADRYAYTQFQPGDLPNYWTGPPRSCSATISSRARRVRRSRTTSTRSRRSRAGRTRTSTRTSTSCARATSATGLFKAWGCDSMADGYAVVVDSEGMRRRCPRASTSSPKATS